MSISHPVLVVQACTLGSMKGWVVGSSEIRWRAGWKAAPGAGGEPVAVVDEQEEDDLPHGIDVAVGKEAMTEDAEVGEGVRQHEGGMLTAGGPRPKVPIASPSSERRARTTARRRSGSRGEARRP